MDVLAIIPARGGSKGVPRKNVRLLGDKPVIVYSIEAAQAAGIFIEIFVTTDDTEIAEVSGAAGIKVPFLRPMELAEDHTPMLDVIKHVLAYFNNRGKSFDAVCLLQPTTPFRTVEQIKEAFAKFKSGDYDSLMSVVEVPAKYNPHWQYIQKENSGELQLFNGAQQPITRRQELPKSYIREGSLYFFKPETIEKYDNIYGDSIGYYLIEKETVNIDTPEDFEKAVRKFNK